MPSKPRRSPYYTDQGPRDGLILADPLAPHHLDVFDDDGPAWAIGAATAVGSMAGPWGEAVAYQIRIGRDVKSDLYIVDRRRFVRTLDRGE